MLLKVLQDPNRNLKVKLDGNGFIKRKFISDAFIEENYKGEHFERPIIDLVQQGGGMYGIALLGYTYIMEKVGIRFYSHGGTSAGAINALFLAAISKNVYTEDSTFNVGGNPHQGSKSEILTHIIANTDFSSFMEKNGIIGWLQQKLFKNYKSPWLMGFLFTGAFGFLLTVYGIFSLVFSVKNGVSGMELRSFDFIIGTLNVGALLIFVYILLNKVLNVKFGINTGEKFYTWADDLLTSIKINDKKTLQKRMNENKFQDSKPNDKPRLVLITSNLSHNRIVKFPERAEDYWYNTDNLKPAAFLRATMSLPFIYKTFIPGFEHYYDQTDPLNSVKLKARFVDGGMLSNFPIREFHRNDGSLPRFPTFGVLLSKRMEHETNTTKIKTAKELKNISLISYIISFFTTFRNFYDNDFLFGNEEIEQRIVTINTENYNWLDFWMDDNTKEGLFQEGVIAAIEQLEKFNWVAYKQLR